MQGAICHHTKFLSICESTELDKLCASKMQGWDRQRIDIPIPKGRNQGKTGVTGLKPVQNLAVVGRSHQVLGIERNPLWPSVPPARPTGVGAAPQVSAGGPDPTALQV